MMRALIVGFLGRMNSGDEMMLAQHLRILRSVGFDEIDLYTRFPKEGLAKCPYHFRYRPQTYTMVLIGGGALPVGFGFDVAVREKLQGGAKVVFSSVNLPLQFNPVYYRLLDTMCDAIITRAADEVLGLREDLPIRYLQDVATIYSPPVVESGEGTAVVVREHVRTICTVAPEAPFDVLVLSRDDTQLSYRYAKHFNAPVIDLSQRPPESHVDEMSRYARVLSIGRYHAALYAAMLGKDYVYLFPTYYERICSVELNPHGRVSWEQLKLFGTLHRDRCKAGLPSDSLEWYGRATMEQYVAAIIEVLAS